MNWFLIAIIAPFLFAISNYIDKYLVSKYFRQQGAGALVIFSSLIGFLLLPLIFLFHSNVINIKAAFGLLMMVNGFFYIITLIPYLYALRESETSVVVPLFQLIPVFTYVIGIILLKENLTFLQTGASLLIIIGGVGISFEKFRFRTKPFLLMVLFCFLAAVNIIVFKFVAIRESFWTTSFWEYAGFSLAAVVLLVLVPSYKNQFIKLFKHNKLKIIGINALNEIVNIIGKIILNYATLLVPVALISVINGFHPFFVFVLGLIFTFLFPKFIKEKIEKKYLFQKAIAVAIMFLGVYFLNA